MKKLTVIFLCLLLASVTLGCGKKNVDSIQISITAPTVR